MSALFRLVAAAAVLSTAFYDVCFAECPTPRTAPAIRLSPADSVTPETRWQIEQANLLLEHLARRTAQLRPWVAMPVP
jgi:hypothetical protein